MNSIWLSLLWKEWREQRGLLAILLLCCTAIPLGFAAVSRDWSMGAASAAAMIMLAVPAAAVFVGASLAAGERSRRTIDFMRAMPTSMTKAALAKLVVACGVVAAPSLVGWVIILILRKYDNGVATVVLLVAGAATASLLIWTAAAGVNHVDEVRSGAVGLLAIAIVWAGFVGLGWQYRISRDGDWPGWLRTAAGGAPGGIWMGAPPPPPTYSLWRYYWTTAWPAVIVYLLVHGALAMWFVARLGRPAIFKGTAFRARKVRPALEWLNAPRRSPLTAIAWKQFRETAPIVALGGTAIVLVAPVAAGASSTMINSQFFEHWYYGALSAWLIAGVFVNVAAGVGLFFDDLRPSLHTFWRSRPISVDKFYWSKLAIGLVVTVVGLAAGPLMTFGALREFAPLARLRADEPSLAALVAPGMLLHAATYSLAALAIVLIRQPVLAAVLTIAAEIAIFASIAFWYEEEPTLPLARLASLGIVSLAACAILAWQAVRRDWGWRAG